MRPCLLLALVSLAVLAPAASAQSSVTGVRDLNFGAVIRGVQSTVAPGDPIKSGRYYVRHILNRQVQLRFNLPNNLARVGGGGNLRITFGATDGVAQGTAGNSLPVVFDPTRNQTFTLTTSADFYVNLGGQVNPRANQPSGDYRGTVTLTCTFF